MHPDSPAAVVSSRGRAFATFPAAVVVAIMNAEEQLLLLASQRRPGWWEPVNGAVEAGETMLAAALRETREEAGAELRVRPLAVVHAATFAYDARVARMISVLFLMAHEGGQAVPGDDMRGSSVRWATMEAIDSERLQLLAPLDQAWLRRRTLALFRAYRAEPQVVLQRELEASEPGRSSSGR